MNKFCQKYSDCEDSVSEIAEILSDDDPTKHGKIMKTLHSLGFHKVKDLARTTLPKFSELDLGDNTLVQLYSAMLNYEQNQIYRFNYVESIFKTKDFVTLRRACEEVHAKQPNDVNVIILLMISYYMLDREDKSIEILHKVPEKYTKNIEGINNSEEYYFPNAKNDYHLEMFKNKYFIECWFNFITKLIEMKKYDNAIQALNIIIHCESNLIKPYTVYGQLMIKLKKFDEANSFFQVGLNLNPRSDESWAGIGDNFASTKKYNSAIICYEKALEFNSTSVTHHINLGFMYYRLQQYCKAIFYLNCAHQKGTISNISSLRLLGHAYFKTGNVDSAMKTYSLCLKYEPNCSIVMHDMGTIYLNHLNNAKAAEKCFKLCVSINKEKVLYYKSLTRAYELLDKTDLAFKTTIQWAEVLISKKQYIHAINLLNHASQLVPNNYYSQWKLEIMFSKLGLDRTDF
ncbi:Tetratricopeptide repeat,Tetratricopeptide repeat-containing domain,Tetratricopeptide-like helical [Cinara cedri]|uniref:Tetratricopeptide repeat,Tetratricopeptide repeat-containing domain,Tetratricopeptide-like helical n=1 Tax=Cinara cedri TaxID=506608 RepID=A0A5E4NR60_9HEMI|nr:Tetratricopeptide repeat,Tetratricopeptide repeat-containing domain,Tetratricopeptide-like helical [Cinara cedri]